MTATLTAIMMAFGYAGLLLLVGLLLRSKIKLFQKIYLPASVIGGFVGLILIQILGGTETFKESVTTYKSIWESLPGVLIIPVFASSMLGVFKDKSGAKISNNSGSVKRGIFWMMCGMLCVQMLIGLLVNYGFTAAGSTNFYKCWGIELGAGFVGGHGTATAVTGIYAKIDSLKEFANTGRDVATTFATFGLIGGIILGIVFINIAARKGQTSLMKAPASFEGIASNGLVKNKAEQGSVGNETTKNYAIETITVHMAIIFAVVTIAIVLCGYIGKIPAVGSLLKTIPSWSVAMLLMMLVNSIISKLNLEWLIDRKLVARIAGFLTDFAIVCAIASMNLKTIMTYWIPILVCVALGFVATYFYIFKFSKLICQKDAPFEHAIISWGTGTGVLMTGLVLLKVCDPDYKTSAFGNFSTAFAIMSLVQGVILGIILPVAAKALNTAGFIVLMVILAVVFTAPALLIGLKNKKRG